MLSFDEAHQHLIEYKKDLGKRAVFRGEANSYDETLPSIDRISGEYKLSLKKVLPNLSLHIWDNKIARHMENVCGFVLYQGKEFGANNLINPDDGLEPRHTTRPLEALMQHYGIPTHWVDFTRDPYVAMLFATQESESDIGYIYYGDYWKLHSKGVMLDLSGFVKDLRKIFPLPKSRPEKQYGLSFRPALGSCGRAGISRLEFKKDHKHYSVIESLFPKDAMRIWFMGQIIDYYLDYVERSRRFNAEVRNIQPDADEAGVKAALEFIISELDLWN